MEEQAEEKKKVGFFQRMKEYKQRVDTWKEKRKMDYDTKLQQRAEQSEKDVALLEKRREWYSAINKERNLRKKLREQKSKESFLGRAMSSVEPARQTIGSGSKRIEHYFGLGKPRLVKKRVGRKVYYYDNEPVHQRAERSLLDVTSPVREPVRERGDRGRYTEQYDIIPSHSTMHSNLGSMDIGLGGLRHSARSNKGKFKKRNVFDTSNDFGFKW